MSDRLRRNLLIAKNAEFGEKKLEILCKHLRVLRELCGSSTVVLVKLSEPLSRAGYAWATKQLRDRPEALSLRRTGVSPVIINA